MPPFPARPAAGPGQIIEAVVEKLVPGGDGLARLDGKVLFIPFTLPGEKVRARVVEAKRDFARAVAVEILEPSPDRVAAPCPVFGRCGGCDWQHISREAQLRHKVALADDALRRIGGLSFPGLSIEAGEPWRYRNRVQIHRDAEGRAGFLGRSSHALVPVSDCPVARPAFGLLLDPGPHGSRQGHPSAEEPGGAGRLGPHSPAAASGAGRAGRHNAWSHPLPEGGEFLASREPGATGPGLVVTGLPGQAGPEPLPAGALAAARRSSVPPEPGGAECIAVPLGGKILRFDLNGFFQSNLEMAARLIPYALDGLSGSLALDLYCGVGLFGAFLADRFERVLAVEENPDALSWAQRNIGDTHDFLRGRVEDLLTAERGPLASARPDAVVVDPPRPGLDRSVADFLIAKRPPRLVYVSCNPATLARDLKVLLAAGFVLDDLRLFDFYPQTAHIEAVAKLRWKG